MSDLTSHMEAFAKAVIAEDVKWLIANPIESSDGIEERRDLYDSDGFTLAAFQWENVDCFKLIAHGICAWNVREKKGWDHRLTLEHNGTIVMTTKYIQLPKEIVGTLVIVDALMGLQSRRIAGNFLA